MTSEMLLCISNHHLALCVARDRWSFLLPFFTGQITRSNAFFINHPVILCCSTLLSKWFKFQLNIFAK